MSILSARPEPWQAAPRSRSVTFWNEVLVPKFLAWRHILVGGLSRHSALIFPTLGVRPGDRILDVGCGFGDTAIMLAGRAGPDGAVLGIDCCDAFLEIGRFEAAIAGLPQVRFVEGDAQTYPFAPVHDLCFARFGTQFFENPVAGLANMRRSLRPGGLLKMIVWRAIADNPWLGLPKAVVRRHLPPPGDEAPSCGPGPFSMADPALVTIQLRAAGFVDIAFERVDAPLMVGRDPDEAVAFQLALGPAGEIIRTAGIEGLRQRDAIAADLRATLEAYCEPEGVFLGSSSWKVTARKPG